MKDVLIQVEDLKKYFRVGKGNLKAVDGLSFSIHQGETVGLVGESGCGKSTAGRTMLRLYEPTGGRVLFKGTDVFSAGSREMHELRKKMQMIFQDPYASLNPRMTVTDIISEPFSIYGLYPHRAEREQKVADLLRLVGLSEEHANRFPHEFSGGQRQRIGVARAMALEPDFIICDEPISALDVSIQAQIVNLLKEIQRERDITLLFIAHDLSMVRYISDRVCVMYLGKMMEVAPSEDLYHTPLHPYTRALLSAIPVPDPVVQHERRRIKLEGDVPSPIDPKEGCRFVDRCSYAEPRCREITPEQRELRPNHWVACHRADELFLK
ncbi:MAG: ATP-binding cassette domain-containing protein [Tissierellia bacterium]|mgnify:CR=1 FL=1|jgi:oligopeptide transport system ATP-binding protein|nr:ATP-binding cassette domain-containing protein [Bacillota bacterium]NLK59011.1 ATP-binding cassette domain-containing protein [Tissierellia bacterium]